MPSHRFRRRFGLGSIRRDPKGEVDSELEFHFARTVEDLIQHGYTPAAAQDEAQRRFGDVAQYRDELEQLTSKRLVRTR